MARFPGTRWLTLAAVLASWSVALPAAELSAQVGASAHRHTPAAATAWLQAQGQPRTWGEHVQATPVASLGVVASRHQRGHRQDVWLVGAGARWQWRQDASSTPSPWFLETQALIAAGRTDALSGPLQFATGLGWQGQRWEIVTRHISNAGLEGKNRGENQVLVGWRF